jgi:2-amino-4-hydroxy-6-hydroxymethyldihydropteridine diphosphokinase
VSTAFVALGSNLSDPPRQLRCAVRAIERLPGTRLSAISRVYRSAAVGPGTQPDYLNAVLRLDTSLTPQALLDALQRIEQAHGRERGERWGPRTLDLDLLLYDDRRIESEDLTVPHPRLGERNFVLYPLLEVAGGKWVLPDGRELDTLVSDCPRGKLETAGLDLDREAAH